MVVEDYVSFETAKLLKEKGFDWECYGYYDTTKHPDYMLEYSGSEMDNNDGPECYISAPTLQMAMKWLREVHRLFIDIFLQDKPNNFEYNIYKIHDTCLEIVDNEEIFHYNTYEEAAEAVIKHCLENLI